MDYKYNKEPELQAGFHAKELISKFGYLNCEMLYIGYFDKFPSQINFREIAMEKFHDQFPICFEKSILAYHYEKTYKTEEWKNDIVYVLKEQILVNKSSSEVILYFQNEGCDILREIIDFTAKLEKTELYKAKINLIISTTRGLENRKIDFPKPKLNLHHSYNDDFPSHHEKMLKILNEKVSGLHLLYGKPGTGKSTYLKYLCGLVKKELVFLPGQLAQNLDNVAMIRYLMDNPNCILIIEDAEELIVSRDHQRNSNLAMVLNITDGILGESLGIQIIATFNTELQNIDPALKRKGRLKTSYEFKALEAGKANKLLQQEGIFATTTEPLTLAEIYNSKEVNYSPSTQRRAVGFR